jgi:regulatory protein spx
LTLTDNGFSDLLKGSGKDIDLLAEVMSEDDSVTDWVDYIAEHLGVLKFPILLGENKLMVGYNSDEIRKFIPQKVRDAQRNMNPELRETFKEMRWGK